MLSKLSVSALLLLKGILSIVSCSKKNNVSASAPFVTSFAPAGGIKGSLVMITRAHFGVSVTRNTKTLNGIKARVVRASNTCLVVSVPAGAAVVSTIAGADTGGFADGPGNIAQFSLPYGIAVGDSGTVYVADSYNHRIRKIQ